MARLDTGEIMDRILTLINESEHLTDDDVLNGIKDLMDTEWGYTTSWEGK